MDLRDFNPPPDDGGATERAMLGRQITEILATHGCCGNVVIAWKQDGSTFHSHAGSPSMVLLALQLYSRMHLDNAYVELMSRLGMVSERHQKGNEG